MTTGNRWGRAVGAGVLTEIAIIASVIVTIVIYATATSRKMEDMMAVGHTIGGWVVCIAGPIIAFLLTRWAIRPLASKQMAHALVVGGGAVALHVLTSSGQIAEGEPLWVFILADALKIVGALAAVMLPRRSVPV